MQLAIQMRDITKAFPGVLANDHICFEAVQGEIHGLLGENGAGKSTLMKILYGLYKPDGGTIWVGGREVGFGSPREAIAAGIGMVHQHFMLIPVFTVLENLILGSEPGSAVALDLASAERQASRLLQQYGFEVDLRARVENISVAQQQRVEILKCLRRGAGTMILDEPTSVLAPQEVEELYGILGRLRDEGHTVILITHKLDEVLRITDRATVLRDGKVVATVDTKGTTVGELARMMVGRDVIMRVEKREKTPGASVLRLENVSANDHRGLPAVRTVSLQVKEGEIVGIAGIDGNGQNELIEVITGLRRPTSGSVQLEGRDVTNTPPATLLHSGLAHIPEDRLRRGLVPSATAAENVLLGFQDTPPFRRGPFMIVARVLEFPRRVLSEFDVRLSSLQVPARTLSGGNQQKLVVGRELARMPRLLIAAQPTWGLDVGATEFIHRQLISCRDSGKAVLLYSLDLAEIRALSDRILVIAGGRIAGDVRPQEVSDEALGLMMAGSSRGRQ